MWEFLMMMFDSFLCMVDYVFIFVVFDNVIEDVYFVCYE